MCSKNKGTDQLHSYCADPSLGFCICRLLVFSWGGGGGGFQIKAHSNNGCISSVDGIFAFQAAARLIFSRLTHTFMKNFPLTQIYVESQRTNGPVNAHLRSVYTNNCV